MGLALISSLVTFDPKLYVNGDNVDYMRLAEAVRHGSLWGSPKFPPLFPWLLAIPQTLFGMALLPQKLFVWLFYLGSAALLIRRACRMFPGRWGAPIGWIAATLIPVLEYGHYVMSEVPYLFFSLLALEAIERTDVPGRRSMVLAAICAAATFYTRSVGLALWGGLGLAVILRRTPRKEVVLFASVSAVLLLPWLIRTLAGPPNPYFPQLMQVNPYHAEWGRLSASGWIDRVVENVRIYIGGEIPTGLLPVLFRWTYDPPELRYRFLPIAVAWIPLLLVAIGMVRVLRKREPIGFYLLFYLLINLLWPNLWTGLRFLVPVLPLFALVLFRGLLWGLGVGESRFPRRSLAAAVLLGVWIILGIKNQGVMAQDVRHYPPAWDHYFKAAEYIRDHAAPDAVIVDRKPAMMTYVTGRKSVTFPREEDPARMVEWMAAEKVEYVVVPAIPYDDIVRYLIPTVQARQDQFYPVYELEDPYTVVLRFSPTPLR
jgi:hypothetical protein